MVTRAPSRIQKTSPQKPSASPSKSTDPSPQQADEIDPPQTDPMTHPGQPNEVAPSFLFLACENFSYMSGRVHIPTAGQL